MDPDARHHLFVTGMAAIELNDTFKASRIYKLLGDQPSDQPHFLDADVSGLVPEVPSYTPYSSEFSSFDSSSDSSVSTHSSSDSRPWK